MSQNHCQPWGTHANPHKEWWMSGRWGKYFLTFFSATTRTYNVLQPLDICIQHQYGVPYRGMSCYVCCTTTSCSLTLQKPSHFCLIHFCLFKQAYPWEMTKILDLPSKKFFIKDLQQASRYGVEETRGQQKSIKEWQSDGRIFSVVWIQGTVLQVTAVRPLLKFWK